MRTAYTCLFALAFLGACHHAKEKAIPRPNILLLVADDLGYADLGCYGGDIETPNIDALATAGIRFSRFHTSPMCAPTRAMLLSGNDNHIAGMGSQFIASDAFGYEHQISDRVALIPELLQTAGYHTYMTGKWHLGDAAEANPASRGFERSFVNLMGAGNHYNAQLLFPEWSYQHYTEDGQPTEWPDGEYSTDLFTDKLISYIDQNKDDGKPFFGFAAYTSPHWPLQVDEPYWRKYKGRYDDGYDVLKAERMKSLKAAGLIPESAVLPPNDDRVQPWESLTPEEQRVEARKMELYAGMVDNLDANIGRLLQYLKDLGQFDNTLIVFMSDNGAAYEDYFNRPGLNSFLSEYFDNSYENMGQPDSYISYGPAWAEAGSAPFRYFKGFTTEGGMVTPMIISGPGVEQQNKISDQFVTLMDLAPSFYEAAGIEYPKTFQNRDVYPLRGSSLMSFASGKEQVVHNDHFVFPLEHEGAQLRKGDWKIVNIARPFEEENFELYNIAEDLAEINDLRESNPEKFQELLADWQQFAEEAKLLFPPPDSE